MKTSQAARRRIMAHYRALAAAANAEQLRQIVRDAGEIIADCLDSEAAFALAAELPCYGVTPEALHAAAPPH